RVRTGWASTEPGYFRDLFIWGGGNNYLELGYNPAGGRFNVYRWTDGGGSYVVSASQSFNPGAVKTLVFAWTSSTVKLSVDGDAFTSASSTLIPTLSQSTFDIGSCS